MASCARLIRQRSTTTSILHPHILFPHDIRTLPSRAAYSPTYKALKHGSPSPNTRSAISSFVFASSSFSAFAVLGTYLQCLRRSLYHHTRPAHLHLVVNEIKIDRSLSTSIIGGLVHPRVIRARHLAPPTNPRRSYIVREQLEGLHQ